MKISDDDKLRFNFCRKIDSNCRFDTGIATSLHECTNYSNFTTSKEKSWSLCKEKIQKLKPYHKKIN